MKFKIKTISILTMILPQCLFLTAYSNAESERNSHFLPWAIISQQFGCDGQFWRNERAGKIGEQKRGGNEKDAAFEVDHACVPGRPVVIDLPKGIGEACVGAIEVAVWRWEKDSWQDIGAIAARIDAHEMKLRTGIQAEGFFKLSFGVGDKDKKVMDFEAYAVVSRNWKKDLLSFCRGQKEEIELGRDRQIVFSSIAVSHFDQTMEMVSESAQLSEKILKALANGVRGKKTFDMGECPDFVVGKNKIRLRRFAGGSIAEFVLVIPSGYDESKKWPVFVHPIQYTASARDVSEEMIDLQWLSILPTNLQWKEYETLLGIIKDKLNIDVDRIYINGECGDGITAMALALKYPDRWAECSISTGNSLRHLAGNMLNLPFVFCNYHPENKGWQAYTDLAARCFEYYGCKYFKYGETRDTAEVRGKPLPEAIRNRSPERVRFATESLGSSEAYWVRIDGREDENLLASIDAHVSGQRVILKTKNVDAYTVDLGEAGIDANKPVEIVEGGESLGFAKGRLFVKKSAKYAGAANIKNERLHGPIQDVFTDPYVVVYGVDGEDKQLSAASEKAARSLANGAPCYSADNVPEKIIDSHNLVLVGTEESNAWISKICQELPVQIKEGRLVADGQEYKGGNAGFMLVYPNPLNPERYVAVFYGKSGVAMSNITKAYAQLKSIRPCDVGIFEVIGKGDIKWHRVEKLNTVWGWHGAWSGVLGTASKKHPKLRWRQLLARIIREELGADIAICEDLFRSSDLPAKGPITYRDLYNNLRNEWIVKIKLDGKSLRSVLMAPFNDISKRQVSIMVVDGISLATGNADGTTLGINELENDKQYTVACPDNLVNGERVGVILEDYEIVGEGHLFVLLRDYFSKKGSLEIDALLDRLRVNVL